MSVGAIIFVTGCVALAGGLLGGAVSLVIFAVRDALRIKASTFNYHGPEPVEFTVLGERR